MFHYIRKVDRQKDLLGYNLSLEPNSFDKLLNALVKKGYHTVHAEDLLTDQALPYNPIILSFDDGYADFYSTAWPNLKKHNFTASTAIITGFMQADTLGKTYMNADQIKTLDQNGVEIFSHTVTHADLSKDPRQQSEIENSKSALEKLLGHSIDVLVYPSGKHNSETLKLAAAAGYKMAFTTYPGLADFTLNDFEQPRLRVDNRHSVEEIIAKL
jgi:peptidoglycan/xylan/chitin deacetylase (PgdA/CDA1 family)